MTLEEFMPIAKKFGLIKIESDFIIEFYIDTHKYKTCVSGLVCTYYKKENIMSSPHMKVIPWNGEFDLMYGSSANLRSDVIFNKTKFVERALTEMFKRIEKYKR